jgi:beta-galactosidase/beta-glucuronidase
MLRRSLRLAVCVAALGTLAPAVAVGATPVPKPIELRSGWEIRAMLAAPAPPQPAPPVEGAPATAGAARVLRARRAQAPSGWRPATVPGVFEGLARAPLYGGTVKQYRLTFRAPDAEGFAWAFRFEQVRRRATVSLNGRRIGISVDPYTPFQVPARGLRPGEPNTLEVTVDSRKDPGLAEGWWNWGGIVRPVTLVPVGRAHVRDLGLMPSVRCTGPATDCSASLLVDGVLERLPRARQQVVRRDGRTVRLPLPQPKLAVWLRSPTGRVTRRIYELRGARSGRRRVRIQMGVPAPRLWSPERPQLYDARVTVSYDGRTTQDERRRIGLRSVEVRGGMLLLNNRLVNLRGASIHEDAPGRGAALNGYDMDTTVRELKELGANVTRAHYVLGEGLLRRFDEAGIMVYDQAPVWQRDHLRNLLRRPIDRERAIAQVRRTVIAARSHPSVIAHSVANELTFTPDRRPATRRFLLDAAAAARDLDPLIPIAVDVKTRPTLPRQRTYDAFDLIGINQYFGWYPWVEDFAGLEPFLAQMRAQYPEQALVMTEFGAEGRPDMADAANDVKGSYAFQANHVARTMDVVDRLPYLSGAIHWTLREFEIFPDWRGGAVNGEGPNDNIRHHKGVLTYDGQHKPAWQALRDRFARIPLYR